MKLIDTHAHIYLPEFKNDIDLILGKSKKVGVEKIFMPNIDLQSIESMLSLEKEYLGYCYSMIGLHPCYVNENVKKDLKTIKSWFEEHNFCAIGEIGIDLHWDKSKLNEQILAFESQINWAKDLRLPIIIHCRSSIDMTIELVRKHQDGNLKGIFHCFIGDREHSKKIIDLNFLVGIGGVVTFKNGGMDKVIPDIELENIVLETDSPYLTPTPYRGKRNEPSYLHLIATKVAELKGCEIDEVARLTSENAIKIFRKN